MHNFVFYVNNTKQTTYLNFMSITLKNKYKGFLFVCIFPRFKILSHQ